MKTSILITIFTGSFLMIAGNNLFAQKKIINESGKPFAISSIVDTKGVPFAALFMSGKEMILNSAVNIISGAGYYEALEGNYFTVWTSINPICTGGAGGLQVDKIEWDENGKCTNIVGLRSFTYFKTDREYKGENIRITSDVLNPKLINGFLFLKFEVKGETEFKFKFSFGQIISIEPSLFD